MTHAAPPRILLLGGAGQVGWELRRTLAPIGALIAPPRAALDLRDENRVRETLRSLRPAAVVNAAAYTDVDGAEDDRAGAFAVNAVAPGFLAEETARLGALLVHYSTDYVFDGAAASPYSEDAAPAPLNVYGESKLAGEQAITAVGGQFIILRTCWVYGLRGRNFLRTILGLARDKPLLRVVHDQIGCPTWSRMLAEGTAALLARLADGTRFETDASGVYHVCATGRASWWEFACAILAADPRRDEHVCGEVLAIRSSEMPTAARRPAFAVLDTERLARTFGLRLPPWSEQLELAMADAQQAQSSASGLRDAPERTGENTTA